MLGYVYIGMDHFALPNDSLAVASARGGCTATSRATAPAPPATDRARSVSHRPIGATYSQNAKTMEEYCDHRPGPPARAGLALSRDDLARRAVIMALMCRGQVLFESSMSSAWLLEENFARRAGPVARTGSAGWWCWTTPASRSRRRGYSSFVRAVAMVFDRLPPGGPQPREVLAHHLMSATLAATQHCSWGWPAARTVPRVCGAACAGVVRLSSGPGLAGGGHARRRQRHAPAQATLMLRAGRLVGYAGAGALAATAMQSLAWLATQAVALRPSGRCFMAACWCGAWCCWCWPASQPGCRAGRSFRPAMQPLARAPGGLLLAAGRSGH